MVRATGYCLTVVLCALATTAGAEREVQVKRLTPHDLKPLVKAPSSHATIWGALTAAVNKEIEAVHDRTGNVPKLMTAGEHTDLLAPADRGFHKNILNDVWDTLKNKTNELIAETEYALFGSEDGSDSSEEIAVPAAALKAIEKAKSHIRSAPTTTAADRSQPKHEQAVQASAEKEITTTLTLARTDKTVPGHRMAFKSVVVIGAAIGALIGAVIAVAILVMHQVPSTNSESVLDQHADDASADELEDDAPTADADALDTSDPEAEALDGQNHDDIQEGSV